jgi:uncharacterized lipoprotein YmbA
MSGFLNTITGLVLLAMLGACGSAPKDQFYTLTDPGDAGKGSLPGLDYGVAVGPVYVPDVVDRPHFVLRTPGAEVRIAEHVRWAEPLREGIARAVAGHLALALDNGRVAPRAFGSVGDADYRVVLDVQRFDSTVGKAAMLDVMWTVRRARDGAQQTGRMQVLEVVEAEGYEALVSAHARAIAALSRNIAEVIRVSRQKDVAEAPVKPNP